MATAPLLRTAITAAPELKMGDTIWLFDINRRVYTRPEKGRLYGEIIYTEHFRSEVIIGETLRSWLVGEGPFRQVKVNKVTLISSGVVSGQWFTEQGKADNIWAHQNRMRIRNAVDQAPVSVLRAIDKLLNGTPSAAEAEMLRLYLRNTGPHSLSTVQTILQMADHWECISKRRT